MSIQGGNREAAWALGKNKKHSLIFHSMGVPFMGFRFKCEPPAWFGIPKPGNEQKTWSLTGDPWSTWEEQTQSQTGQLHPQPRPARICTYACAHTHRCIYVHTCSQCTYIQVHVGTHTHVHTNICTQHTCIYIYVYTHTHAYTPPTDTEDELTEHAYFMKNQNKTARHDQSIHQRTAAALMTPATPSACSLSQSVTLTCGTGVVQRLTAPAPSCFLLLTWTGDGVGSTPTRQVALTPSPSSRRNEKGQGSAPIPATRITDSLLLCGPWSCPPHGHSSNILAYKFLTSKTWAENALYPGINENL